MKTVFCYGDSNTYGYVPFGAFGERLPEEQTWPGLLGGLLDAEVFNAGENGRPVPRNCAAAALELAAYGAHLPADEMIVMLGTNDLMYPPYLTAKEAAGHMQVLLQYLKKKYPATGFLLVSPVPVTNGPRVLQSESRSLAAEYRQVAEALKIPFSDAAGWAIPLEWDGVHFTSEGHRIFAEKIAAELRK